MSAALFCSMMIGASASTEVDATTSATTLENDTVQQKVTVVVDTLKANKDLEEYYKENPSYDRTKEDGKKAGKAIKEAVHATKRKVVNGEDNTGAGDAAKAAVKATGETVVEATKTTGRYIKKQTPVVVDSIKSKSKRTKEKIMNW